jgi:membrane associated rhomboid family serine protease
MPKKRKLPSPYKPLLYLIAGMWGIEVVNLMTGHHLNQYGIYPRTLRGLMGIPFSPFLHASIAHLAMNTVPLAVLGGLVLANGRAAFLRVTVMIVLGSGIGIWVVGRPAFHVGASTLAFGYFGYLLASGFFKRGLKSFFLALVALVAYGGMFYGLLPTVTTVSWEGHLCGFAAGILIAVRDRRKAGKRPPPRYPAKRNRIR